MERLQELINEPNLLTGDQIFEVIELIGNNGDIIIIKNDGLRIEDKFTVVITFQGKSVRSDRDNLNDALIECLKQYLSERN